MYSILGKLAALQPTPQEKHDAKVQQIRESVESQGSILKGLRDVSSTEARLAKQFAESDFSKLSNKIQKSGKSKDSADAIAATIGREKLGQKEMTRRSVAGRKDEAVRIAGNTKGPVGHYSQMKHVGKDGSPEAQAHRDATAGMAKSARAAGSKLPFNKTTEPTGKLATGGYNAMTKGVTPIRTSAEECAMCESGTCTEHMNEDLQADAGQYYTNAADFFGKFEADTFDSTKESPDGMQVHGYVDGQCVMAWQYKTAKKIGGWGNYNSQMLEAENQGLVAGKFYLVSDYGNGVGSHVFNSYDEARNHWGTLGGRAQDEYYIAQFDGKNLNSQDGSEQDLPEGEITHKPGVTTHRKTDFPGYPTDDGDDIEDANKGKRGRPRKHAVKVAKTDAEGNKLGRGRPKKDAAPVYSKMNDPFGRVPNKAPKTKLKGRTHTMAEAMDKLSQRFSRISEGINFAELLKSKHQTVDEMLSELQQDIKQFKDTGHCSELLKDCMEIKGYHGKVVADEATNPSNPFYKKQNDYNLPPAMRGHGTADYTLPDVKAHDNIERDHYRDRAGLPPLDTSLEEELSELAKLAGLSEVSRGDYIKQKDTEAEHSGKNKFQAFGQEFDTDEITEEPNEGNTFTKGLEDDDVEIGDKIPGTNAVKKVDIDESVEDTINVATNMSSNGDKNVTVTANGSQAAELLQMLRIAGLGNGQAAQNLQGQADTPINAQVDGEEGIEVIELPAQEPEVDEAETHVDDAGANPVNAPNEKYMSMKGSTMGPGEGDSGEKAMNPDRPTKNNGDNALATPPTRAQKTLIAVSALESKLAAEYESIKKLSA